MKRAKQTLANIPMSLGLVRGANLLGFRFFVFHAGDHMETLKVVEHV